MLSDGADLVMRSPAAAASQKKTPLSPHPVNKMGTARQANKSASKVSAQRPCQIIHPH